MSIAADDRAKHRPVRFIFDRPKTSGSPPEGSVEWAEAQQRHEEAPHGQRKDELVGLDWRNAKSAPTWQYPVARAKKTLR
ncbi:MAG TPA: hypothetical protein PKK12_03290 [Candidatus Aminicenantes bacterium]|nr:hypothetical protein [Candidatus Aminicenantes bacterium]